MKRIISLCLALLLLFSAAGCAKKEDGGPAADAPSISADAPENTENNGGDTKAPEKEEVKQPQKEETPQNEPTVYDLKCRSSSEISWKTANLRDAVTGATITFSLPSDWSLEQTDTDAYSIVRGGRKIGDIKSQSFAIPKEELDKVSKTAGNLTSTKQISLHNVGGDNYYHSFSFKTNRQNPDYKIYLRVLYTELDTAAADKLYTSVKAETDYINYNFPAISSTNGAKKIVAMGNSFTGHSRVAPILNEMLAGSGYSAIDITIANSAATAFAKRDDILSRIESGEFCYVVQSGFYESIENITALEVIKAACDKSGTRLVVMPAHNEDDKIIRVASSKFHDVMFVNWKAQLDSLINSGTPRSDLCTDDNVKHCKPLAGYVAAFMLYRNMFGKNPPAISGTNVPQSEVQKLSAFTSSYTPPKSGAAPTFTGDIYVID